MPTLPDDPVLRQPDDRLGSWKAIAAYLKRDVSTVQRWEKFEGMPVHRHLHAKRGSVYGSRAELDAWWASRAPHLEEHPTVTGAEARDGAVVARPDRRWWLLAALLAIVAIVSLISIREPAVVDPLSGASYSLLTEFEGAEHAGALSRDGKFAAFLSDRDGRTDVWVTQVGTGEFHNLTKGRAQELLNDDLRTVAFSPDGALVLYWERTSTPADGLPAISVWAVPTMGGALRRYLPGGAEVDWSSDGTRVVYHPPAEGDPLFVTDSIDRPGRQIHVGSPGVHNHFPLWAPDDSYVYFVQGAPGVATDLWRVEPDGGRPERMTSHESRVSHPAFIGRRTLLYLATLPDGSGPWLHALDVGRGSSRRITAGVERYSSLAASADGRRLLLTTTRRKSGLWRAMAPAEEGQLSAASRIALPTADGRSPRLGTGALLFVASKGGHDSIWKLADGAATEIWTASGARLVGAPAISPDGQRVAFAVERGTRATLHVMSLDTMDARPLREGLDVRGSPAWSPDGASIAVAALDRDVPRLFAVSADGGPPRRIVDDYALEPSWSPDGRFLVYSGAEVGPQFPVHAATPDGKAHSLPAISLSRGARRLVVRPDGKLVALRGEVGRGDLVEIDLASGAERTLVRFADDFVVRDFDVAPDGREVVFDRLVDDSDLVLIDR